MTIQDSSAENGGALACFDSNCSIESSIFSNNTADSSGGALYFSKSNLTILPGNQIKGNTCNKYGGGLYISSGKIDASLAGNSIIANNSIIKRHKPSQFGVRNINVTLESNIKVDLGNDCLGYSSIMQKCDLEPCFPKCLCAKEYFSQSNGNCKNCPDNQSNCFGDKICESSCFKNSCLCETGYFCDPDRGGCSICDKSCQNCTDSTSSDCISCKEGYFLQNNSFCEVCHESCLECVGILSNQCVKCEPNQTLRKGSCEAKCGSDEYITPEMECLNCNKICKSCENGTEIGCLSCFEGKNLINGTRFLMKLKKILVNKKILCGKL